MTENKAGKLLQQHFPFAILSSVPLFRADTPEGHLFANQADHILHMRRGEEEKLVVIECKDNILRRFTKENSKEIALNSKCWYARYFGQAKEVRKQVRGQIQALFQCLRIQERGSPVVEGWVVHAGRHPEEIRQLYADGVLLIAMTNRQFKERLERLKAEGWKPVAVHASQDLTQLKMGRHEDYLPHPPTNEALQHVDNLRFVLDGGIFTKFHLEGQKRTHWAISGSAGSGKSVLLAYAACVFRSNRHIVSGANQSVLRVLESVEGRLPATMPALENRRIYVYAMSSAQVDALESYYAKFWGDFEALNGGETLPGAPTVHFAQWTGEIPADCTVLIIDEGQDLSLEDQEKIANWHANGRASANYLAVAIDHQQRLKQHNKKVLIIQGMNFSGKTTTMTRSYRQPFPAAITGIALLFRWFSQQGAMIRPPGEKVSINSKRQPTLRGCLGAKVATNDQTNQCVVTMRNDSHPGNHWRRTADLYEHPEDVARLLATQQVDSSRVLWVRFTNQPVDADEEHALGFQINAVSSENLTDFLETRVKGLEYPIVVIEGMPDGIDNIENEDQMWMARRQLYLCTSRANGFLYFVLPPDQHAEGIRHEISRLLEQLSAPVQPRNKKGHEVGKTWRLRFRWRTDDVRQVPDFDDAMPDPAEIEAEEAEELSEAEIAEGEDLEEVEDPSELIPEMLDDEDEDDGNDGEGEEDLYEHEEEGAP